MTHHSYRRKAHAALVIAESHVEELNTGSFKAALYAQIGHAYAILAQSKTEKRIVENDASISHPSLEILTKAIKLGVKRGIIHEYALNARSLMFALELDPAAFSPLFRERVHGVHVAAHDEAYGEEEDDV